MRFAHLKTTQTPARFAVAMRTYVVRLADLAAPPPGRAMAEPMVRGVIDDVRTGERTPFRSTEELISLLTAEGPLVDRPGEAQ